MATKRRSSLVLFYISLITSILMVSSLVFLALTALQTARSAQVVAQFFTATKEAKGILVEFSQLNSITPMETIDRKLLDEMMVRYYLEMRYTQIPDQQEMAYRWGIGGPVHILSGPLVYNEFSKDLKKKIESLPDVVKTIQIQKVTHTGAGFDIDFLIFDNYSDGRPSTYSGRNVMVDFTYSKSRRRYQGNYTNPYGIVFTRFSERIRKE